ncbi:hypothetical protein Tco_1274357 [Tanacetum coccineum]
MVECLSVLQCCNCFVRRQIWTVKDALPQIFTISFCVDMVSFMRILGLREVARTTARIALEFAPDYAFSVSLLLTPLCCDDIHDVTPRVSALAGCDKFVSGMLCLPNVGHALFMSFQRIYPEPQPRELKPSFEARMQEYMALHAKRIERFEKAIFKQRDEINGRMAEMFGLLKELTSRTMPKKVLVREEIRNPITKNVNAISLCRIKSKNVEENNEVIDKNITKHGKCSSEEAIRITNKEPLGEKRKMIEPPGSQPVSHYLKHKINKELIKGLVENQRFDNSLLATRVGKMKRKTYNELPIGPMHDAILKKKITKKEDMGGNFV